jgi:Fe-S-cluster-containing hydrogenase component 2
MIQFSINEELCTLCDECAADCPAGIIAMDGYPAQGQGNKTGPSLKPDCEGPYECGGVFEVV